jgi:hypothetical protein
MANFTFDIALGRVAEFYNRVDTNDPANSALIVVILRTAAIESDATLKPKTTLSAVLSGATDEATNTNYARKTLTDTSLAAMTPGACDIPDQTWTAVAAGDGWSKLLVCYDSDTTAGTDANIIPLTAHDFVVTPDGTDIVAQIATAGFFGAS